MKKIMEMRTKIVEVGKLLYNKDLVVACEGNISARLDDDTLLCTPSGLCKGMMTPEQLIITDLDGKLIDGDLNPSSEVKMHAEVYRQRPDVKAIVHAHPATATGFACAGQPLNVALLPEIVLIMGTIPLSKYATPSTDGIPRSISTMIKKHDCLLLGNHGALAAGPDLMDAFFKMESIEHLAKIFLVTKKLGGAKLLSRANVEELLTVWGRSVEDFDFDTLVMADNE